MITGTVMAEGKHTDMDTVRRLETGGIMTGKSTAGEVAR
jgi:hypothetical protein